MQNGRQTYAKHPLTLETGDPAAFVKVATGGDWVPTVINPSKTGGMSELALFYVHIIVWVVALLLSCIANFGAGAFMPNATNASGWTDPDGFGDGVTGTTVTIGILGGVTSILGVGFLLGGAAILDADAFKNQVWLNTLIQFLTLYGTSASFFIFCKAAEQTSSAVFWISLFGVIFMLYAQVLLYCTSAALDVLALPRAFIPSLAASVQFISALSISGDEFHKGHLADGMTKIPYTDSQKFLAWMVPVLTLVSVILMVGLRRYTRDASGVSQLGDRPFLRSLVLMPFLSSGVVSVYKMSFIAVETDVIAWMFAFFGMLLNFAIITVVFIPGGGAFAAQLQA